MSTKKRKIRVTSALPYANGDIHLGHLVEYLQTDFWVRFQKMRGHDCQYFCADDTHGTPIMIAARKEGITPEELVGRNREKHLADFHRFEVDFDHYGSTNSAENRRLTEYFYHKMAEAGHIETRSISQLYCQQDEMFLPDRFVRGECPRCGAPDQYGDSCDKCSATYATTDIKNPRCSICGTTPVEKESPHMFFRLEDFRPFLTEWLEGHVPADAAKKLQEWLKEPLRSWDISRDAPYFGFEIPGQPGKFFYVWVDAPIGYLATASEWAQNNALDFKGYWEDPEAEIYHFIGKDILYFHTLFWPAMLKTAGCKLPDQVFIHGFLTVDGEKMSKSKGTFVKADTYLEHLDPLFLRYYYASKLNGGMGDIDLSIEDFQNRVNSELIGKLTNLASRSMQMLHKNLEGRLGRMTPAGEEMCARIEALSEEMAAHYEARDFSRVIQTIRQSADEANRYIDAQKPWESIKTDAEGTRSTLTDIVNLFRLLTIYISPILPSYAAKAADMMGEPSYRWSDAAGRVTDRPLKAYTNLATRLQPGQLDKVIEASIQAPVAENTPQKAYEPLAPEITIDTFVQMDLRVARILCAEEVKESKKLVRVTADLGFGKRQIFAGIRTAYAPEKLVGRLVIVAANLKPRQMKFGLSEGMILAAGEGGEEIFLLSADSGAEPGQRIH
jgi:methionyl-tRNA synthetase